MKRLSLIVLAFLLMVFTATKIYSQNASKEVIAREQVWLGYFYQAKVHKNWGVWFDAHYRQTDNFLDRPFQFMVRPAATYFLKENLRLNAGYLFNHNFPAAGQSFGVPEHRPWQQIWWLQKFNGISVLQFLRLEQRFIRRVVNNEMTKDYSFNHRFRFNVSVFVPITKKDMLPGTPFVSVINEIFINAGQQINYNYFDQNRFFAGLGYQFSPKLNVQLGYSNVFLQTSQGGRFYNNHVIRCFVFHNFNFVKQD
jgi:hypothetical protein